MAQPMQSLYPDPELSQMRNPTWPAQLHTDTQRQCALLIPNNITSQQDGPSLHSGGFESQISSQISPPQVEDNDESSENEDDLEDDDMGEDLLDADEEDVYGDYHKSLNKFEEDIRLYNEDNVGSDDDEDQQNLAAHFRSNRRGLDDDHQPQGPGRPRGTLRGPRKAAEPTGELKLRLGMASQAFLEERYSDAAVICAEVIRLNAETYEAWSLLASVFQELGDSDFALKSMIVAATLRPRQPSTWFGCANFALLANTSDRAACLVSAQFSYSKILAFEPKNYEARLGRASVFIERQHFGPAVYDLKYILTDNSHDLEILRLLAEASIDLGDVQSALELYKATILHFKSSKNISSFGWTDVDICATLYDFVGEYESALEELRRLARWLLGRGDETFWDGITGDDREWDADNSRRLGVPSFVAEKFPLTSYGDGLPIELRVKLGLYRIRLGHRGEAMNHFKWLIRIHDVGGHQSQEWVHLYRQVADQLFEQKLFQDALFFYEQLKELPEHVNSPLLVQIGKCSLQENNMQHAEDCFRLATELDENDTVARMELAKIYEAAHKPDLAFNCIAEVMLLRAQQPQLNSRKQTRKPRKRKKRLVDGEAAEAAENDDEPHPEASKAQILELQYRILRTEHPGLRAGDPRSTAAWMMAAKVLTDDFRSFKPFYPWDKYLKFLGYGSVTTGQEGTALDSDVSAMADRLAKDLDGDTLEKRNLSTITVPTDYRGISFDAWLDLFLEYALCLSRIGDTQQAYELCEAATDAIVYYHSRENMFLIHICWSTCALLSSDEETCVTMARYFTTHHQFTTDSYRMFAAITRLCQSPVSWYCSGPTQKYVLRQIKAMDFSLVEDDQRRRYFAEKASYSALDNTGRPLVNEEMDLGLLMLYGHILSAGASHAHALNYFFRAYALDPQNSVIQLSIGLAYVHHGLKRQSENRQHNILQGISFISMYHESRKYALKMEERQEAHFNIGRVYQMLGLAHLAIPYYQTVLDETSEKGHSSREDLIVDAAYNLQTIYMLSGNIGLAREVTGRWLRI